MNLITDSSPLPDDATSFGVAYVATIIPSSAHCVILGVLGCVYGLWCLPSLLPLVGNACAVLTTTIKPL